MNLSDELHDLFERQVRPVERDQLRPPAAPSRRRAEASMLVVAATALVVAVVAAAVWTRGERAPEATTARVAATGVAEPAPPEPPLVGIRSRAAALHEQLGVAQSRSNAECLAAVGIDGYVPLAPTKAGADPAIGEFGLEENLERARSYGYATVPGQDLRPAGDPAGALELSAAEQELFEQTLFGERVATRELRDQAGASIGSYTETDGCINRFYVAAFGDVDTFVRFLELETRIDNAAIQSRDVDLPADPAFRLLVADWQGCVRAAGFNVDVERPADAAGPLPFGPTAMLSGPNGAGGQRGVDWGDERPTDFEREVATADVSCKIAGSFTQRATARLVAVEQAIVDDRGLVADVAELDALIADATQRLAGTAPDVAVGAP